MYGCLRCATRDEANEQAGKPGDTTLISCSAVGVDMASPGKMMKSVKGRRNETWVRTSTLILCALGMVLSIYSVYVEVLVERMPGYQALCDISPTMSCSRVFSSRFSFYYLEEKVCPCVCVCRGVCVCVYVFVCCCGFFFFFACVCVW